MDDYSDILGEPTPAQQALAAAAALRRQQQLGTLAQLTGDPVLGRVGQSMLQGAQHQAGINSEAETRRQQQAIEAQRAQEMAQYHQGELALGRARLDDVGVNQLTGQYYNRHGPLPIGQQPTVAGGAPNPLAGLKPNQVAERWDKFDDAFDINKVRSLLGQGQQSLQRAEALEALLHVPDLNAITPQQVTEAASNLAGLIAKGGPQAISQIEHLTPQTMASKFADIKQYLFNKPEGAEAKAFLENMLDTARREKQTTVQQMHHIFETELPKHYYLRTSNPGRFDSTLAAVGLDPSSYDENGRPRAAANGQQAAIAHYKSQLQPGERLAINAQGKGKALAPGEAVPPGFQEVP